MALILGEKMKKGDIFENFGCKWVVDDVYETSNPELFYKTRYKAHIIEAPKGYNGVTEIDAALTV